MCIGIVLGKCCVCATKFLHNGKNLCCKLTHPSWVSICELHKWTIERSLDLKNGLNTLSLYLHFFQLWVKLPYCSHRCWRGLVVPTETFQGGSAAERDLTRLLKLYTKDKRSVKCEMCTRKARNCASKSNRVAYTGFEPVTFALLARRSNQLS